MMNNSTDENNMWLTDLLFASSYSWNNGKSNNNLQNGEIVINNPITTTSNNTDISSLMLLSNNNNVTANNINHLMWESSSLFHIDPLLNIASIYNQITTDVVATQTTTNFLSVPAAAAFTSYDMTANDSNIFYNQFSQEKQQLYNIIMNSSSSNSQGINNYTTTTAAASSFAPHHHQTSSSQEQQSLLLHQQEFFNNHHSFVVEPFTTMTESSSRNHGAIPDSLSVVQKQPQQQQKKKSGNKRKKLLTAAAAELPQEEGSILTLKQELQEEEQKEAKKIKQHQHIKKKRKRKTVPAVAAADVDPNAPPKPKRITGLNKPLILSNSLQTIMEGATELSRPEIVKRLWNYIKFNQLQDPADRRYILCDEKLKLIFQKDRVNSFGMNRNLSAHLTKKEDAAVKKPSSSVDSSLMLLTQDEQAKAQITIWDASLADNLIKNNITPSSIIINTSVEANSNSGSQQQQQQLMIMDDFSSPVPTAETLDIMTPSDSDILLQKWASNGFF